LKLTAHLKNLLAYHQAQISVSEYADLEAETMRLVKVYFDILSPLPAGAGRARKIHQLIEDQNELNVQVPVSCTKGCGACCHLEVEITEDDAKLLAQTVQAKKLKIDFARLESQARRQKGDEAWKKRSVIENRCVFLDEANCCSVYEFRPMICRKHAVVSSPSECMSVDGHPVPRVIPINEIIASAVINLPMNHYDSLPKMLFRALENEKELAQIHNLEFIGNEGSQASEEPSRSEFVLSRDEKLHGVDKI
jgi:Fe-S-cluster containining protein